MAMDGHEFIKNWVYRKIGAPAPTCPFITMSSWDEAGKLLAACVYLNYRGHDLEMVFAAEHPRWCTRSALRSFFWYPFVYAKCIRVTAFVAKHNKRSRKLVAGVGFKQEGTVRHGYAPNIDAVVYGMLQQECRWLTPDVAKLKSSSGA